MNVDIPSWERERERGGKEKGEKRTERKKNIYIYM